MRFHDQTERIRLVRCVPAGAALTLAKIVMPYLDVSEHAASALNEGNVASALVVPAHSLLILSFCIMAWGK